MAQIDLSGVFAAAFGSIYADGTLHRITKNRAANGDSTPSVSAVAIKGQVDTISEAARAAGKYADREQRLIVLRAGVGAAPTLADQITLGGIRWALSSVETDPAQSHWVIRGRPA